VAQGGQTSPAQGSYILLSHFPKKSDWISLSDEIGEIVQAPAQPFISVVSRQEHPDALLVCQ
jgi:hypothetical protein